MVFVPPTDAYAQASAAAQPSSNAAPDTAAATPAMTTLYSHAVGPLNTAYYLDVFDRLDGSGRSTVGWNWAAALCTLNWLIYRRLWNAALVYLAAAEGLALLVFGVGRPLLNWPAPVEWGVIGAFVLASIAAPGWYGNGLMYAEVRKRIDRALTASATVAEAGERLEREAPTRRRLQWIVAANAGLGLLAVLAALWWPKGPIPGDSPQPEPRVWDGGGASAPAPAASAAATSASAPTETAPAAQPTTRPAASSASAETPPTATAPVAMAEPAPAIPAAPVAADAAASNPAAAPGPRAFAPATAASSPASAPARSAARKASAPQSPRPAAGEPPRATERKASSPAPAASRDQALVPVGSTPGFYLNVGLFADEANARKAQARLLNEGLPAFRQELDTAQGRRIRVRVGPYATRAQAERAAASVRALSLEAVVFQKKP
ncbi:MAG: SPOR domain-containing protein [Burkholderiaceae bacterium]